jgi:hypothetical protein
LIQSLRRAVDNGFSRVHVDCYATNRDVVRRLGGSTRRTMREGVVEAVIELDAARPFT